MNNHSILSVLVCPNCRSSLIYDKQNQRLICKLDKVSYPIKDGVPVMLIEESSTVSLEEIDKI